MVAMLKIFKPHLLLNAKSDWELVGGIGVTWRFRFAKIVPFQYPRAILKFFKRHLPNCKWDWAKTWWEVLGCYGESELLNCSVLVSKITAILKFFKPHLLQNSKSDWAETWWEASRWHGDSELLKSFSSNIQDGGHGSHLKSILNHICS